MDDLGKDTKPKLMCWKIGNANPKTEYMKRKHNLINANPRAAKKLKLLGSRV